jgi:hypothetical protein
MQKQADISPPYKENLAVTLNYELGDRLSKLEVMDKVKVK